MSKKPDALGVFLTVIMALTGIGVLMFGMAAGLLLAWLWS